MKTLLLGISYFTVMKLNLILNAGYQLETSRPVITALFPKTKDCEGTSFRHARTARHDGAAPC
jgi:hypothetical protein